MTDATPCARTAGPCPRLLPCRAGCQRPAQPPVPAAVAKAPPARRVTAAQPRLFLGGRYQLVQSVPTAKHAQPLWALPGGGRASTAQLLALARRRGWNRPVVIEVTVRYAVSPETNDNA